MEWRQVPDHDKYLVSENGELIRIFQKGKKRVRGYIKQGYLMYTIVDNYGVRRAIGAHRLVAMTFLPNHKGYGIVRHKDGNEFNNQLSNLEWGGCTEYERILQKKSRLRTYERNKAKMVSK